MRTTSSISTRYITIQDYYKEQGFAFIMLVTGQIHQKMISAVKAFGDNTISVDDILLMARCRTLSSAFSVLFCQQISHKIQCALLVKMTRSISLAKGCGYLLLTAVDTKLVLTLLTAKFISLPAYNKDEIVYPESVISVDRSAPNRSAFATDFNLLMA